MPAGRVSGLIIATAAALAFAGAANAQVPIGMGPLTADQQKLAQGGGGTIISARRFETGAEALQAKNYAVAESVFQEILRQNPTNPDINFLMGVTKMGLEKWDDAKKYLEIAVRKAPKNPDPKARLGVTLVKLGDMEGAMKQRADLVNMDKACKGECRNAFWITNAIAMIDAALS